MPPHNFSSLGNNPVTFGVYLRTMRHTPSRLALRLAAIAALAGATLIPAPARAWVSFGFALPPVVVAPPVAPYPYAYPYPYYPPAYPAPAPGYYPPAAPPAQSPAPQLSQDQRPYGSICAGLGAPSYGSVR